MVELKFTLDEEDYLNLQLFHATTDPEFIKQRKGGKYRISGMSLLFGLVLLLDKNSQLWSYLFIASSVIFFVIYPWWSAWFYKRMYKKQISETSTKDFPHYTHLVLDDATITIDSKKGKSVFNIQDVDSITEIKDCFYIKMKQFVCVIIPKEQIADISALYNQLEEYETKWHIPFIHALGWKWK